MNYLKLLCLSAVILPSLGFSQSQVGPAKTDVARFGAAVTGTTLGGYYMMDGSITKIDQYSSSAMKANKLAKSMATGPLKNIKSVRIELDHVPNPLSNDFNAGLRPVRGLDHDFSKLHLTKKEFKDLASSIKRTGYLSTQRGYRVPVSDKIVSSATGSEYRLKSAALEGDVLVVKAGLIGKKLSTKLVGVLSLLSFGGAIGGEYIKRGLASSDKLAATSNMNRSHGKNVMEKNPISSSSKVVKSKRQ